MRYITGSRICMFSCCMSTRARSTREPSANSAMALTVSACPCSVFCIVPLIVSQILSVLSLLPANWLSELPGQLLSALHVELADAPAER